MTTRTADHYAILGLTSDATLADVKKAYRRLARLHHPDRNNADPGAIDRFRRITEAYEYLSAHLKDNAHGNGQGRPAPTAPPRADVGMPGARHSEIPPVVVIIIASGTTGRDARWGYFGPQRWTIHTTGTLNRQFARGRWLFQVGALGLVVAGPGSCRVRNGITSEATRPGSSSITQWPWPFRSST